MAQFGRPDSDVTTGSWTVTPLWSKIDEVTASATDLVTSSNDPSSDAFEVHTTDVTDPAVSTGHFVRAEHRMRYNGGGSPGAGTVQVELYQGTTQIATATHNYASNSQDVLNTTTISLTGGEADSITNYSDLRIRITANKTSGARTTFFEVTWAEIEVPDVADPDVPATGLGRGEGRADAGAFVDVQVSATARGEGRADAGAFVDVQVSATARGEGRATGSLPLVAPTGVTYTPGDSEVQVDWTSAPGATHTRVYRGVAGGRLVQIAEIAAATQTYTDTGKTPTLPYVYHLRSWNGSVESDPTDDTTVRPTDARDGPDYIISSDGGAVGSATFTVTDGNGVFQTSHADVAATTSGLKAAIDTYKAANIWLHFDNANQLNFLNGTAGEENATFNTLDNMRFSGVAMDGPNKTVIANSSTDAGTDTEPLSFTNCDHIIVEHLEISAGGNSNTTSDGLDFDNSDECYVHHVHISATRARGLIFDGKDGGAQATLNVIEDVLATSTQATQGDVLELLGAKRNVFRRVWAYGGGERGMQLNQGGASVTSDDNVIEDSNFTRNNEDGIEILSGNRNIVRRSHIEGNDQDQASHDGVEVSGALGADDNEIRENWISDVQGTKTQHHGVDLSTDADATIVHDNMWGGNEIGTINDSGTNTDLSGNVTTETTFAPTPPVALWVEDSGVDVVLRWYDPPADDLSTLRVYRGPTRDNLTLLASGITPASSPDPADAQTYLNSYTDTDGQPRGKGWWYAVTALDSDGNESLVALSGKAKAQQWSVARGEGRASASAIVDVQISGTARGEGRAAASATPDNGYWGPKTVLDSGEQTQWGPYRASNGDHYTFQLSGTTLQARKAAFVDGDRTLDLDGTDDYASAPDTGWTVGGGDLDLRANLVTDWQTLAAGNSALVSKRDSASDANQSFIWIYQTNRRLRINWNETGGTERSVEAGLSTITAADGDRLSVRVTVDVDNGAGQYEVKFYTSPDTDLETATWTQLGTTVTGTSGVSSVRDTTSDLMAGAYLSGAANPVNELDGQIYSVRVFDGGTLVEGFDANDTSIGGGTIPGLGTSASTWTLQNNAAIISGAYGTIGGTQTTGLGNDSAHDEIQGAWNYEYGEMQFVVIDRYSGGSSGWICDTHGLRFLPSSDSWSTAAIETGYEVTIDFDFGIDVAYDEAEGSAYFTTIGPSEFITATWWRRLSAARWNGSSWDWFNAGKIGPSFESIAAPQGSFSGATRVYAMSGGSSVNDLYALDNSTRSASSEATQQQHLDEGPGAAFDGSTFGADAESPGEIIQRTEGDPAGAPSDKTPAGWGSAEFPTGWTLKVYCGELFAVAHSSADAHVSYSKLTSAAGTWRAAMDVDRDEVTFTNARLLMVDKDDRGVADTLWLVWEDGTDTCYREWIKFGACATAVAQGEGRSTAAVTVGSDTDVAATGIAAGEGRAEAAATVDVQATGLGRGEGRSVAAATVDVAAAAMGAGGGRASAAAVLSVTAAAVARGEGASSAGAVVDQPVVGLARGEGASAAGATVDVAVSPTGRGEGRSSAGAITDRTTAALGRGEGAAVAAAVVDVAATGFAAAEGAATVAVTVGAFTAALARGEGAASSAAAVDVQAPAEGRGEGRADASITVDVQAPAESRGEGRSSVAATVQGANEVAATGSAAGEGAATAAATVDVTLSGNAAAEGRADATTILSVTAAPLGAGEGRATLTPTIERTAAPRGAGEGSASVSPTIERTASSSASGEGSAAASAIVNVTAQPVGRGEGRGSVSVTVGVQASPTGRGEGRSVAAAVVTGANEVAAAAAARGEGRSSSVAAVDVRVGAEAHGDGRAAAEARVGVQATPLARGEGSAAAAAVAAASGPTVSGLGRGEGRANAAIQVNVTTAALAAAEGRAVAAITVDVQAAAAGRGEGAAVAGVADASGILITATARGEGRSVAAFPFLVPPPGCVFTMPVSCRLLEMPPANRLLSR